MRPPVFFINTDQCRLDFLGCYGFPVDSSPHIDQLAADGVLVRNVFTQCPICVPARYALTTGHYKSTHGALTNYHTPFPATRSLYVRWTQMRFRFKSTRRGPKREPFWR